jgi:hypothetical protein
MNKIKLTDVFDKNFTPLSKIVKINGMKVEIKTYLDADKYAAAVKTIADTCFQEGTYCPEYRELARKYVILKYFTNIEVSDDMVKEIFKTSQNRTWFSKIESTVTSLPVWTNIESSVNALIDYRIRSRKTSFDELCDSLKAITAEMAANTNGIDMDVIKNLTDRLNGLSSKEIIRTIVKEHENDKFNSVGKS